MCPICASVPGGDPNHVTDDFAAHLALDHRSGAPRDLISFYAAYNTRFYLVFMYNCMIMLLSLDIQQCDYVKQFLLGWLYNTLLIWWLWRIWWWQNLVALAVNCQVLICFLSLVSISCFHILLSILEKDAVQWKYSLTTKPRRTFRLAARSTADTTPRPRHQQGRGQAEHDLWVGTAGGASPVCSFRDHG